MILTKKPAFLMSLLAGFGLLSACSGSGEDVRIKLCKDLVAGQLGHPASITWNEQTTDIRRAESLTVNLRFEAADKNGGMQSMQAACFYRHNAVDDTALTLSDPLSAYSTSPYRMTLNGRTIANPKLAQAIKGAMLDQGKAFLDKVQQGIEEVTQKIPSAQGD